MFLVRMDRRGRGVTVLSRDNVAWDGIVGGGAGCRNFTDIWRICDM